MTRTDAIHHARRTVSALTPSGHGWKFATLDTERRAWHERQPQPYHAAQAARRAALIHAARAAAGLPETDPATLDGRPWTDAVPARPRVVYRPAWTHHPRCGVITGYAGPVRPGLYGPERGLATTEAHARAGEYFTHAPANQIHTTNPPTP